MKKLFLLAIALTACTNTNRNAAESKKMVLKAEQDFNDLAATKGIAAAFYQFADSNATIKREHDTLIKGRENILKYYSGADYKYATVTWKPDFVELSADGTLAYTYGNYLWNSKTADGKTVEAHGVFHTVWKKQKDGSFKYVWD